MSIQMNQGKVDWISKAKGLGILGIVAVHTVQRFVVPEQLDRAAWAGMYCVQLFFVVSAYLTFKSLDKETAPWSWSSFLKYFGHKLVRLIPVLYTAVLWHFLMYAARLGRVPGLEDRIWKDVFFGVTFLNGFSYHHINPWVNWYLGDLVIFYALAPLLYKWIDSLKKSVLFFVVSMLIGWLSTLVLARFGFNTTWYFYFWFPRQLPLLAIGIMFYHFQKSPYDDAKRNSLLTLAFVVSLCFLLSLFFQLKPMEVHVRYGLFLFVFSYTLFNHSGRLFNWLKVLGEYSYGIYLYHWCLLTIFDFIRDRYGISKESVIGFICCYFLLVMVSLLVAMVANKVLERPFFRFMRERFKL